MAVLVGPWFPGLLNSEVSRSDWLETFTGQAYQSVRPMEVLLVIGFTLAATMVYSVLLVTRKLPESHQARLQLSGDLVLVSLLVYTFGGISSPFIMLYPVVIVLAALMLGKPASATSFASAALAAYTLIALIFLFGGDLSSSPEDPGSTEDAHGRLAYNMFVALVGFYATARLGTVLSRRTRQAETLLAAQLQELEAQRERLQSLKVVHDDIIQSIVSGLMTTDLEGNIASINRAGLEILGLAQRSLVGEPVENTGLFDRSRWLECVQSLENSARGRFESQLSRHDETVYVGYSLSRLHDAEGTLRGYIVIFQDLTQTHKLQQELRVRDRMAIVGGLAAGLAHEIGNPLTSISGSAQMLGRRLDADSQATRLLDIILKESQRLDRIIKDFLQFAGPAERRLVRFDIAKLLREHVALLENSPEVTADHRLDLSLSDPQIFLEADPDQISQIFWNLTRNALRAMPQGGTLRVDGQKREKSFQLLVQDDGVGIPEELKGKLFDPFQSHFKGGTGIGLPIVYSIVEAYGGRIEVDSSVGEGSTFLIELPLSSPPLGSGAPLTSPPTVHPPQDLSATAPDSSAPPSSSTPTTPQRPAPASESPPSEAP